MAVRSAPSRPRTAANAWRDSRTAARSVACFSPTEPSATVEKPWTRPGSSASSGTCSAAGVVLTPERLRTARAEYLLDLPLDLLQVHELPVHRRKADVSNLVQVAQPVHHHLTDLLARDLDASRAPELRLDVVDDRPQPLGRDVALLSRLLQAVEQLLGVEVLAAPILLGDEERHRLDALIGGESLPALQTLTPAPDRLADL